MWAPHEITTCTDHHGLLAARFWVQLSLKPAEPATCQGNLRLSVWLCMLKERGSTKGLRIKILHQQVSTSDLSLQDPGETVMEFETSVVGTFHAGKQCSRDVNLIIQLMVSSSLPPVQQACLNNGSRTPMYQQHHTCISRTLLAVARARWPKTLMGPVNDDI